MEVVSTLCRKARERNITVPERDTLIETFRADHAPVCADIGLLNIALEEGLSVENPNKYL